MERLGAGQTEVWKCEWTNIGLGMFSVCGGHLTECSSAWGRYPRIKGRFDQSG